MSKQTPDLTETEIADPRDGIRVGKATCRDVRPYLAGLAEDDADARKRIRTHVAGCLRCQLDVARARKAREALSALRTNKLEPNPLFLDELLTHIETQPNYAQRHHRATRAVAVAGAAAAIVGVSGAIVLVRRRNH